MGKIDNNYLKKYLTIDREIKDKQKTLKQMKEEIVKEIENRKGKAIVTRFFIAMFQLQKRISYVVPVEIKQKYKQEMEYNLLRVTERRTGFDTTNKQVGNEGAKKQKPKKLSLASSPPSNKNVRIS